MNIRLDAIRACLDGATPAVVATCARDGAPNVSFLSQAHYVDPDHVGLTFQFFNKTRRNVLENPRARLLVWDPGTAAMYRLDARYERTETEGPTFERMRAMLAGIASHTGMAEVFRLRGADIYRVLAIHTVAGRVQSPEGPRPSRLPGLRAVVERLLRASHLDALCQDALVALAEHLDVPHSMLLAFDRARSSLYTVATHGYERPGVGAEIPLGAGVIGVAASARTPIRITHVTSDRAYVVATRTASTPRGAPTPAEIAWPGLPRPGSQVALPIVAHDQLLGVLFAESARDGHFGYEDEDALAVVAAHVGASMLSFQNQPEDEATEASPEAHPTGKPALLRHYKEDDSVFLDDDYVIKGVAGAILWAMATDYVTNGRANFTNRELRLDPRIPLPALGDNLEARLVTLQRRLAERSSCLRLERTGRGRLRLVADRPLELAEVG